MIDDTADDHSSELLAGIWSGLGGDAADCAGVEIVRSSKPLPSAYDVTGFAATSVAAATLAVAELHATRTEGSIAPVRVDSDHASVAFRSERYLQPVGWELPPIWDPIAGDYRTSDGWIRLHTNYVHHRGAALAVLGCGADRDRVALEVATWKGDELETAVVDAGGCAAMMRSSDAWRAHPQGVALRREPLVSMTTTAVSKLLLDRPSDLVNSPLAGIRVLDLTRVIAGPVCTRVLGAYGADVLRIDPPGFAEVGALLGDTTAGKRRAALDLRDPSGRTTFEELVAGAHVIVHGYRGNALAELGFTPERLRELNPALVMVSHDAYGWSGPWAHRRGFDSLVQMSCGIADRGRMVAGVDQPTPLPAQALDHGTGYLLAAATCRLLTGLVRDHVTGTARLSLARTADVLTDQGASGDPTAPDLEATDVARWTEDEMSAFGPLHRVRVPGTIEGVTSRWSRPAGPLGRDAPTW